MAAIKASVAPLYPLGTAGMPPPWPRSARRKGMGESIIKTARSYAIRAEIKIGEMVVSTKRAKGTKGQLKGNPLGGTPMVPPKKDKDAPTLAKNQRYWMAMERTRDQGSGTRATKNQKLKTKNQKPKKT